MIRPKQDKPLASALLAQAKEVLEFVERTDVTDFRNWLLGDLSKPLVCIGNGGKHTTYPALLYKAFSGKNSFTDKLNFDFKYDYFINKSGELPDLKKIKHFVLLYGSYGEPVAHDIESSMVEGGIASVQICDYRNFCHGRFIFAGNHCQSNKVLETDVCAILLTTPREAKIAESLRKEALADNMPIVQIHTELDSSLATIQLLMDSLHFVFDLAEKHLGLNPNSPHNFSGIDKRKPMNSVRFVTALKEHGELSH